MNPKRIDRYVASLDSMEGKKVVVTGANSGLGLECTKHLLKKGAHVVMACRNPERMEKAKAEVLAEMPQAQISTLVFDQGSLASVDESYERLVAQHPDFDAIVLNAGVFRPGKNLWYAPGVPLTSGTNFVSLLYLVTLLDKFLADTTKPRKVVIQGSAASYFSFYTTKERCMLNNSLSLMKQYNFSKLGSECVFKHFQQAPHNPLVKYLLSEPGACKTGVFRYSSPFYRFWVWFFTLCIHFNSRDGALPMTKLVTQANVPDGEYLTPRIFFHMRGLPGRRRFPRRFKVEKIISDGYEIIDYLKNI